jgi:hypothetical protein
MTALPTYEDRRRPGSPHRVYSGLFEVRFDGERVGLTRNLARACITARNLGHPAEVEEIRDGQWKPFGLHYMVLEHDAADWRERYMGGRPHITVDEAQRALTTDAEVVS